MKVLIIIIPAYKNNEYDSKNNLIIREPKTLQDKMIKDAVIHNKVKGEVIIKKEEMGDLKYQNHEKVQYVETSTDGHTTNIHFVRDVDTGEVSDVKFKTNSNGVINLGKGKKVLTTEEKIPNK